MTDNHLSELTRIITASHWPANARTVIANLFLLAAPAEHGSEWRKLDMRLKDFAKIVGVNERTCSETLKQVPDIADVHVERIAVDRFGVEIPANALNFKDGDKWVSTTTLAIVAKLPDELPALGRSKNQERACEASASSRREFAEIKTKLDNLLSGVACPHCNEVGQLHGEINATCGACGSILDESELALLVDGEEMPAKPESEKFSVSDEATERRLKLRKLQGIETPTVVDDDFVPEREAGVSISPKLKSFQDTFSGTEKFSVSGEKAPSAGHTASVLSDANLKLASDASSNETLELPSLADDAILTGDETLAWFENHGGDHFTHCEKRGKRPFEAGWPDNLHTLEEAQAHLAHGGNVGWEGSGELVQLDTDFNAASFVQSFAQRPPIVFRRDACPERCKVVVKVSDPENLKSVKHKLSSEDRKPVFEVLASRHQGVIAGVHESGATICLWTGDIPTMSAAEIEAHYTRWLDETYPADKYPNASWRAKKFNTPKPNQQPAVIESANAHEVNKLSYSIQIEQAIAWFNCDPKNQDAAMSFAQQAFNGRGNYIALRPDDKTPSAYLFSNDAFIDYGEFANGAGGRNGVTDVFELHCMKHPEKQKRQHVFEVVNAWRASIGANAIPDVRK